MNFHPSSYPRLPHDKYFSRDPVVTDSLILAFEKFGIAFAGKTVWEPCAGAGHLMSDLERHGMRVAGTDLVAYDDADPRIMSGPRYDVFRLDGVIDRAFDFVISNTPHKHPICERMITHLLKCAPHQHCCFLVPVGWESAKGMRRSLMTGGRLFAIAELRRRPTWFEPNAKGEHKGPPEGDYHWLLFNPLARPVDLTRHWWPPGEKSSIKLTPEARVKRKRKARA